MSTSEGDRNIQSLAPHRGGLILVMGILSFAVCGVFGIVAWIMGNKDLAEMRAGRMDPSGEGMTQIGRIIGMVVVLLNVVSLLILVVLFGVFGGLAFMSSKPAQMDPPVRIERNVAPNQGQDGMPQMPKAAPKARP